MDLARMYIMKRETMLFKPVRNERENLDTLAMESRGTVKVSMSPTDLIDQNLRYFGSSFNGASQGSRAILGNITMCPIVVNQMLDFYWFPTKSPTNPDCIWFALHHIERHESICKKTTRVFLSNGTNIDIKLSSYTFEKKIQRAYKLKYKVEERTRLNPIIINESLVLYDVRKIDNERTYARK
ncbi:competence protein ComK [Sporosarcina sp. FA9]|uniref:competence protein ComK n=1 Tax=Sporosarcina sp. FA9 TaxID=3413030 RepID=UPI003F659841